MEQDRPERYDLVRALFFQFQKLANDNFVNQVINETNYIDIVDFIDAIKNIKHKNDMPKNLSLEIKRIVMEKRLREHDNTKGNDLFGEQFTKSKSGYLNLIIKSMILNKRKFLISFNDFWKDLNEQWSRATNKEDQAQKIVEYGNDWLNNLTK